MTFDTDFLPRLDNDDERELALSYWDLLMDSLAAHVPTDRAKIYGIADQWGVAPARAALIWNNVCRWLASKPLVWA